MFGDDFSETKAKAGDEGASALKPQFRELAPAPRLAGQDGKSSPEPPSTKTGEVAGKDFRVDPRLEKPAPGFAIGSRNPIQDIAWERRLEAVLIPKLPAITPARAPETDQEEAQHVEIIVDKIKNSVLEPPRCGDFRDLKHEKLYKNVDASVVSVTCDKSTGTGFAIGKPGQILTNYHCVDNTKEVFVTSSEGKEYRARVTKIDDVKDLALLEIVGSPPASLKPLPLGDETKLGSFPEVFALGHPEGAVPNHLSAGILLDKSKMCTLGSFMLHDDDDSRKFLQNDILRAFVDIRPGNSGGPGLGNDGTVLGVVSRGGGGIGCFIPATSVRDFLAEDSKFKFDYKYSYAPDTWPGRVSESLKNNNFSYLVLTGTIGGIACLGNKAIQSKGPLGASVSAGSFAFGAAGLIESVGEFRKATNDRDLFKAGLGATGNGLLMVGGYKRYFHGIEEKFVVGAENRFLADSKIASVMLGSAKGKAEAALLGAVEKAALPSLATAGFGIAEKELVKKGVPLVERQLTRSGKIGLALMVGGAVVTLGKDLIPDRLTLNGMSRTNGDLRPPFKQPR